MTEYPHNLSNLIEDIEADAERWGMKRTVIFLHRAKREARAETMRLLEAKRPPYDDSAVRAQAR